MKENEAPENIYLLPDDRNPNGLSICWYDAPYRTGAIEYTRTDAFIEKVLDFFENDLCCYIKAQDFTIEHEKLETDFKNAMKL